MQNHIGELVAVLLLAIAAPVEAQYGVPVQGPYVNPPPGAYSGQYGHSTGEAPAAQANPNGQAYPFPYPFPGSSVGPGAGTASAGVPPTAGMPAASGTANSGQPGGGYITRRPGLSLADVSWTYEPTGETRQFRINDQVTVTVKELSSVKSQGDMNRLKQGSGVLTLSNWILLNKFAVVPDPQSAGDPTVGGSVNNQLQTQSDLSTKDQMQFTITCRIADRRPNGLLVLEGVKSVNNNEDSWEQCLTGVVRPEDIMPNNTITSDKVAELKIVKREAGYVRDGYRRGWLLKWLDTYQPF